MRISVHPEVGTSASERALGASFWEQAKHKIGAHPKLSRRLGPPLDGLWRVRIGNHRVVYEMIEEDHAFIIVAAPRSVVYDHAESRWQSP